MIGRITFNTTEKSRQAIEEASKLSGSNKTDCLNKAIQLYAYLLKVEADGGEIRIKDNPRDSLGRLRMF